MVERGSVYRLNERWGKRRDRQFVLRAVPPEAVLDPPAAGMRRSTPKGRLGSLRWALISRICLESEGGERRGKGCEGASTLVGWQGV